MPRLRKLVAFPDKEGKTRIIGILDYFSQTALRPLHNWIFTVLKRIPQDRTFTQSEFMRTLSGGEIFYSIDLSAATDRFPIQLIENVLKGRFPTQYVSAWKRIMVGTPFDYNGKRLSYAVGNPMGAYSSWNSFTLAHHYVVYYCCKELQVDWKHLKYALLGDDIVIAHEGVAKKYLQVISSLGIDVSMAKTHVSNHGFEFAKRWFVHHQEITPFPLSSLKESTKRYYSLVNLLIEVGKRGWFLAVDIPSAVDSIYTFIVKRPSRFRKSLIPKVWTSECIMKVMQGSKPAD